MIRLIAVAAFALAVATSRPGNVARAASSGGRHDHASARSMWCRYAHGEWCLHNYIRSPACPPRSGHRPLKTKKPDRVAHGRATPPNRAGKVGHANVSAKGGFEENV